MHTQCRSGERMNEKNKSRSQKMEQAWDRISTVELLQTFCEKTEREPAPTLWSAQQACGRLHGIKTANISAACNEHAAVYMELKLPTSALR